MKILKTLKSNQGFTLVELMVAGVILAVLILAFASFFYQQSRQTKQTEIRQNYNQLKASITTVTGNVDTLNQSQYLTTSSPGI